jgi:hypothetical protein
MSVLKRVARLGLAAGLSIALVIGAGSCSSSPNGTGNPATPSATSTGAATSAASSGSSANCGDIRAHLDQLPAALTGPNQTAAEKAQAARSAVAGLADDARAAGGAVKDQLTKLVDDVNALFGTGTASAGSGGASALATILSDLAGVAKACAG